MAGCDATDKVKALLRKMAAAKIEEGHTDPETILSHIHDAIQDHTPLHRGEIADIITGHGGQKATKTDLQNRVAAFMSELRDLRKVQDTLGPNATPVDRDPARATALRKQIADLQRQIDYGPDAPKGASEPDSPAIAALKAERDGLKKQLDDLNPAKKNALKDAARQKVIEKQMAQLQDRIAKGDYSKPDPRAPPEYSDEVKAADQKLANIKAEYKTKLSEFERANRSPAQKIMDAAVNFKRTVWLGSVSILAKLGWAANAKVLTNAMRRMTAGALHHIPGVNWVSRQAPLEGGGFRQQAAGIAEGARHLFSKETTQTFKQNVTRGYSDIAAKYSKEAQNDATTGLLKYIYHTHTGAKTPIEVNSFNTGTKMLTEHYLKDALDRGMSPEKALEHVNSPTMQLFIGQRAYDGGVLYDKLSNANKFTSGIKMLTKFFASGKPGDTSKAFGMAGKFAVDFAMPIMKVGTNFAAQRWAASGGGYINSFVQLMAALKKTPDGLKIALKPDQADYIMRNLSAATLGLAIRALGYYYYKNFSGFYQPGQQTKDKPETAKIAGVHIPRLIFDNDMLTQLQAGATLARVEAKDHSFAAGLWRSEIGEIDGLPMMDTLKNFAHLSEEKSPMRWLGREAASDLIPGDLNWLGQKMDNDTKRKPLPNTKGPKAAWQEFESHLPVLRKNVPRSPNQ